MPGVTRHLVQELNVGTVAFWDALAGIRTREVLRESNALDQSVFREDLHTSDSSTDSGQLLISHKRVI